MRKNFFGVCAISILICSAISGCASAPTSEQIANADYGRKMLPDECRTVVERAIAYSLKDPSSAQFRHQPCYQGWAGSAPILGMSVAFGYVQQGEVNGKNSFGAYVGFRSYQALLRNGVVVRSCISDENGLCIPRDHYPAQRDNFSQSVNMSCGSDSDCDSGQSCRSRKGGGTECR